MNSPSFTRRPLFPPFANHVLIRQSYILILKPTENHGIIELGAPEILPRPARPVLENREIKNRNGRPAGGSENLSVVPHRPARRSSPLVRRARENVVVRVFS
nr:hypothetical protein Itr_chr15CG03700 [Ipomoea trifida]